MTLAASVVSDTEFNLYLIALAVSGLLLAFLAISGFGASSVGERVLNGLFAAGFLGYAFYLFFIFDGGEFREFYYAFAVPVILVIKAVQGYRARKAQATEPPAAPAPQQPAA
jgi:hypothetical protein